MVWTERTSLAHDLWRYGEDELWKRVYLVPKETMDEIGRRASDQLDHGEGRSDGSSMLIAKALALAAVEVLEGSSRPLRRARRRPEGDFPGHPVLKSFIARHWFDHYATRARRMVQRGKTAKPPGRKWSIAALVLYFTIILLLPGSLGGSLTLTPLPIVLTFIAWRRDRPSRLRRVAVVVGKALAALSVLVFTYHLVCGDLS